MKTNVGSLDATVRFILGIGLFFMVGHGLGWWALLGLWPILTAAIGFCPLYLPFHFNTVAEEEAYEARHHHVDPTKKS